METINQKTGFSKRTHMLECEKCGENEYAESIGLWNDDGSLKGAICGACESKPIKKKSAQISALKHGWCMRMFCSCGDDRYMMAKINEEN